MSAEDLDNYETDAELALYREYRDVIKLFSYVVETDRRFYLANSVSCEPVQTSGGVYFRLDLKDAWVWDIYRPSRFVKEVHVLSFKDVNIEEIQHPEDNLDVPESFE